MDASIEKFSNKFNLAILQKLIHQTWHVELKHMVILQWTYDEVGIKM